SRRSTTYSSRPRGVQRDLGHREGVCDVRPRTRHRRRPARDVVRVAPGAAELHGHAQEPVLDRREQLVHHELQRERYGEVHDRSTSGGGYASEGSNQVSDPFGKPPVEEDVIPGTETYPEADPNDPYGSLGTYNEEGVRT